MNRATAFAWIKDLEAMVDNKLQQWIKKPRTESDDVVQLSWQWHQTRMILNVFWADDQEGVYLQYSSPRTNHDYLWTGLNNRTFNRVMDRTGNLAQTTMHPPIEPLE